MRLLLFREHLVKVTSYLSSGLIPTFSNQRETFLKCNANTVASRLKVLLSVAIFILCKTSKLTNERN